MKDRLSGIFLIALIIYLISFIICGFFGEEGQEITAHGGGLVTLVNSILACALTFSMNFNNRTSKYTFFISSGLMAVAYFMYIFLHIEPSDYADPLHSFASMLFDIATSGLLVSMVFDKLGGRHANNS